MATEKNFGPVFHYLSDVGRSKNPEIDPYIGALCADSSEESPEAVAAQAERAEIRAKAIRKLYGKHATTTLLFGRWRPHRRKPVDVTSTYFELLVSDGPGKTVNGAHIYRHRRHLFDPPDHETADRADQVGLALWNLDEKRRDVVLLLFYEGLGQCEVGRRLNLSQQRVSVLKRDALKELGRTLKGFL